MDPNCRDCQNICKRLDSEDAPVRYNFAALTPGQIMLLIEKLIQKQQRLGYLKLGRCVRAEAGNQLAMSLRVSYPEANAQEMDELLVIAQAEGEVDMSSSVFFRFHVHPSYCQRQDVVRELNDFVIRLVKFLDISDKLLADSPGRSRDELADGRSV